MKKLRTLFEPKTFRHSDGTKKWYRFDDGEVTEASLDDDEEMKSQCFGGDSFGESYDHVMKK